MKSKKLLNLLIILCSFGCNKKSKDWIIEKSIESSINKFQILPKDSYSLTSNNCILIKSSFIRELKAEIQLRVLISDKEEYELITLINSSNIAYTIPLFENKN